MSHGFSRAAFGLNIKRGNTAANLAYAGYDGEITIDTETGVVRLHDGITPGGQRLVRFDELGMSPAVFEGEVPASSFIQGDTLASTLGIVVGSAINATTPWLKFSLDGKTVYIPKMPIRDRVSWGTLYDVGAVYGTPSDPGPAASYDPVNQDAQVVINNETYHVRLMKGTTTDPAQANDWGGESGFDQNFTHGSEWNRLMYPIHNGTHTGGLDTNIDPDEHADPNVGPFGSQAQYSDADLGIIGMSTWCQETGATGDNYRIYRGRYGLTYSGRNAVTYYSDTNGWRPLLELVG